MRMVYIIYSLPWFKTWSPASKGSQKRLVENKFQIRTQSAIRFVPAGGSAGLARGSFSTWRGRRRWGPPGTAFSRVPAPSLEGKREEAAEL